MIILRIKKAEPSVTYLKLKHRQASRKQTSTNSSRPIRHELSDTYSRLLLIGSFWL